MLHPLPQLGDVTVGVFSQPQVLEKLEQKMEDDAILCLQAPCGMRLYCWILINHQTFLHWEVQMKRWAFWWPFQICFLCSLMHFDSWHFPMYLSIFKIAHPGEISLWIPGSPNPKWCLQSSRTCFSWKCWVRGFPTQFIRTKKTLNKNHAQSLHKSSFFPGGLTKLVWTSLCIFPTACLGEIYGNGAETWDLVDREI